MTQKYHAFIKGKNLLASECEETQWIVVNKNLDSKHLGLGEPDDYEALTKQEWSEFGIDDTNADFVKVEELEE